ncbi:MAG: hypothetical protein L0241_17450 [Planctomycetia bacterium]|nr:hypothetical protein [Planctomycetia bacterium]
MMRVLLCVWVVGCACAVTAVDDPQPKAEQKSQVQDTHWWSEIRLGGHLLGFSADGKRLAATDGKGKIEIMTVPEGKVVTRLELPANQAVYGEFTKDGKQFITVSPDDKRIRYWSLTTGKEMYGIDLPKTKAKLHWVVGFSPGGKTLALKMADGIILVDTDSGEVILELPGAGPGEGSFKMKGGGFSPDGKRFATGTSKSQLAVWDVETGKQLASSPVPKFPGTSSFVHIQFSPDGRWITTANGGSVNFPIQVWDAKTCELLAEPRKENSFTTCLSWTPVRVAVECSIREREARRLPEPHRVLAPPCEPPPGAK